jgi:hypothetical protein
MLFDFMMSPALLHLYNHSFTMTDLHRRLRLLQEVLESVLYSEPPQMRVPPLLERVRQALPPTTTAEDTAVLLSLEEAVWNNFSPATVTARLEKLRAEADQLPIMKLYLPVPFTDKQLAPLAAWVRSEVAAGLMFEIAIDPKVVGGCAFVYKDTHFDWSLRRYLRAKKGMITTLLNSYEH